MRAQTVSSGNVERHIERFGDFEGDRHAAARQGEHEDVGSPRIMAKARDQGAARVSPIREEWFT